MSQITKQVASLYKYYSNGATKDVPHIKLLTSLVTITFLLVFAFLLLLGKGDLMFTSATKDNFAFFMEFALKLGPLYILYNLLFSKKKLEAIEISSDEIRKRNKINLIIIIVAIILIPALLIFKYGMGK